ncbi:MAG: sulfur oxidation c-type cytochrome SoxX [Proteobacteria bacterium]|nr:MAG: sulfur oxidation c-type cytochrome SoxX [Pseudomonadota bacterium]
MALNILRAMGAALFLAVPMFAFGDELAAQQAARILRQSMPGVSAETWNARIKQDATQAACSRHRNQPPEKVAAKIVADAADEIRYPSSGVLIGNWKVGERLAKISTGGQVSKLSPEALGAPRGGNCYACHVLAADEVAAGTLGPNLTGYGKLRGTSPEVAKALYQKIYNAQASVPCSLMPRFGHNGWLTPEQIADIVAYLLDAESPVNQVTSDK